MAVSVIVARGRRWHAVRGEDGMPISAPTSATLSAAVVDPVDRPQVIPLLMLAEPSYSALRWSLDNLSDTVYRFDLGEQLTAVATMRWNEEPCELIELAVAVEQQRTGIGRQVIEWLVAEARRRGIMGIQVGTSSTSLGNIAFYQRCGFRPLAVRRDYFWYYPEPVVEEGVIVRDMLVFDRDVTVAQAVPPAARGAGLSPRSGGRSR